MTPPATFKAAIHTQFDRFYPGHDGGKVSVKWKGGTVCVEIPCSLGTVPFARALSEMQEAIIEALSKHCGDPVTGEDLAGLAGYEKTGGAWNRAIKGLVDNGMIENCRPGYRLRNEAIA